MVKQKAWYDEAQSWAVSSGISDGTQPAASVTREQFATMLYRFAEYKKLNTDGSGAMGMAGYTDVESISAWARDAMTWAVLSGVMEGSGGALRPQALCSRAEAAQILTRFAKLYT